MRLVEVQRQAVLIDACPQCRGIWLDRGELEKLVALEAHGPDHDPEDDFFAEVEGRKPSATRKPERQPQDEEPRGKGKKRRGGIFDVFEDLLDIG